MNLTFKQLEALLFSARLRSFSAAALKLHTTQSAISKRVAELGESLCAQCAPPHRPRLGTDPGGQTFAAARGGLAAFAAPHRI